MANTYKTSAPTDTGSLNYHIQDYALVQGLGKLAYDLVVTKLITNYSADAANQGSRFAENVRVPIRGSVSAADKTPGTAVTPSAATSTKVDIAIDTHKTWDILIEDYGSLFAQEGLMAGYMQDAAQTIAEAIETSVIANYSTISTSIGSAGGNASAALMRQARYTARSSSNLFNLSQPMYAVWGVYAESDLLGVDLFVTANQSGSTDALERAYLGKKFGFENYTSNMMPSVSGSPGAEYNLVFQRDAFGIAFVDMNLASVPESYTGGVRMRAFDFSDDDGVRAYSLRSIVGYDQLERGTVLTVDTIYGTGEVRDGHAIVVIT